ncbi:MAG TPA: serine hydrolase, partial [Bdellovibrionota bacterium]|nr:serine hydrolase [Bdellovibrionota bacterium]
MSANTLSAHPSLHVVAKWGDLNTEGQTWLAEKGQASDLFDLASLTKPILTSSLLMMTCERSQRTWSSFLETTLGEWIPELDNSALKDFKLRYLWEHRSGLESHIDFDPTRSQKPERSAAWRTIATRIESDVRARGLSQGEVYSDLGFFLLGLGLERFHGRALDELWSEWKSLHGIPETSLPFFKRGLDLPALVPTETRYPLGEVNDNNAQFLGGVAPHAGLAGTADDVWQWLQTVRRWVADSTKIAPWLQVPEAWTWRFYCGWDTPEDPATTLAGSGAPTDTLGHLGYTGTALWWSPSSARAGVLLTNRIYPAHAPSNVEMIKNLRREFFSALWQGTLNSGWQIPINKNGS